MASDNPVRGRDSLVLTSFHKPLDVQPQSIPRPDPTSSSQHKSQPALDHLESNDNDRRPSSHTSFYRKWTPCAHTPSLLSSQDPSTLKPTVNTSANIPQLPIFNLNSKLISEEGESQPTIFFTSNPTSSVGLRFLGTSSLSSWENNKIAMFMGQTIPNQNYSMLALNGRSLSGTKGDPYSYQNSCFNPQNGQFETQRQAALNDALPRTSQNKYSHCVANAHDCSNECYESKDKFQSKTNHTLPDSVRCSFRNVQHCLDNAQQTFQNSYNSVTDRFRTPDRTQTYSTQRHVHHTKHPFYYTCDDACNPPSDLRVSDRLEHDETTLYDNSSTKGTAHIGDNALTDVHQVHQFHPFPTEFGGKYGTVEYVPRGRFHLYNMQSYRSQLQSSGFYFMQLQEQRDDVVESTSSKRRLESLFEYNDGDGDFEDDTVPLFPRDFVDTMIHQAAKELAQLSIVERAKSGVYDEESYSAIRSTTRRMMKHFNFQAKCIIRFAQKIPGFQDLHKDTQISLLRKNTYPLVILNQGRTYEPHTDSINFFNFTDKEEKQVQAFFPELNILSTHLMHSGLMAFYLQLSEIEYAYLSCLLILNGDYTQISDGNKVKELLDFYTDSLYIYETEYYSKNNLRFGEILLRLPEFLKFSHQHLCLPVPAPDQ